MDNVKLVIQHEGYLFEPPIESGVKLEWERTGSPGKLTFTVIKTEGLEFTVHYCCCSTFLSCKKTMAKKGCTSYCDKPFKYSTCRNNRSLRSHNESSFTTQC